MLLKISIFPAETQGRSTDSAGARVVIDGGIGNPHGINRTVPGRAMGERWEASNGVRGAMVEARGAPMKGGVKDPRLLKTPHGPSTYLVVISLIMYTSGPEMCMT